MHIYAYVPLSRRSKAPSACQSEYRLSAISIHTFVNTSLFRWFTSAVSHMHDRRRISCMSFSVKYTMTAAFCRRNTSLARSLPGAGDGSATWLRRVRVRPRTAVDCGSAGRHREPSENGDGEPSPVPAGRAPAVRYNINTTTTLIPAAPSGRVRRGVRRERVPRRRGNAAAAAADGPGRAVGRTAGQRKTRAAAGLTGSLRRMPAALKTSARLIRFIFFFPVLFSGAQSARAAAAPTAAGRTVSRRPSLDGQHGPREFLGRFSTPVRRDYNKSPLTGELTPVRVVFGPCSCSAYVD